MYEKYKMQLLSTNRLGVMTHRKPYSTDISNQQWAILKPLIPAPKTGGRPRSVNMREIINAIFYILAAGCAWRLIPHDLPPWSTLYHYFWTWRIEGTWLKMHQVLREKVRTQVSKKTTPSARKKVLKCCLGVGLSREHSLG